LHTVASDAYEFPEVRRMFADIGIHTSRHGGKLGRGGKTKGSKGRGLEKKGRRIHSRQGVLT